MLKHERRHAAAVGRALPRNDDLLREVAAEPGRQHRRVGAAAGNVETDGAHLALGTPRTPTLLRELHPRARDDLIAVVLEACPSRVRPSVRRARWPTYSRMTRLSACPLLVRRLARRWGTRAGGSQPWWSCPLSVSGSLVEGGGQGDRRTNPMTSRYPAWGEDRRRLGSRRPHREWGKSTLLTRG